ncbi:MAG: YiiX/YebB-like N1pC/P60 family cysteine hydrolase [Elusimicrobia bacterium]|nr:YiiX/YebB-like N1pC/P60 family cysteine hydrolase [Elusimicrobiota bacterium]
MTGLFELRRELGRRAGEGAGSAAELREAISRARHIQDDIAVSLMAGGGLNSGEPFKGELSVQKVAGFSFPDSLNTGDIMLSRGTNMMGSLAARMSATPGEFSHLGMVYRDPETRKLFILASDTGVGATVEPIEKFLSGRARLIVMRYKDAAMAEKAAQLMRVRLEKKVPYDYSLNSEDDSALYCTEVAAAAFKMAGQIKVPLQMSSLPGTAHTSMYSDIGIARPQVFLPQDLEVDPRFEVMAEWTDYSRIGELNEIDAVYGKMAQWMEKENYVFSKNILYQGIGGILSTLAKKKIRESLGDFSGSDIRHGLDYGLTLYQFVTLLRDKLDKEVKNKAGYHSLADLNRTLEKIRTEEYRQYKESSLHLDSENTNFVNIHSFFKPKRM